MANCAGSDAVDVRAMCCEKWLQLPVPTASPSTTKPMITQSLVTVSEFCILAVNPTPRQLRMVRTAIRPHATAWAGPRCRERIPEPSTMGVLACDKAGKKWLRYSVNASAVTAIGAEKPAKKETQPVMNPHSGPNAWVR